MSLKIKKRRSSSLSTLVQATPSPRLKMDMIRRRNEMRRKLREDLQAQHRHIDINNISQDDEIIDYDTESINLEPSSKKKKNESSIDMNQNNNEKISSSSKPLINKIDSVPHLSEIKNEPKVTQLSRGASFMKKINNFKNTLKNIVNPKKSSQNNPVKETVTKPTLVKKPLTKQERPVQPSTTQAANFAVPKVQHISRFQSSKSLYNINSLNNNIASNVNKASNNIPRSISASNVRACNTEFKKPNLNKRLNTKLEKCDNFKSSMSSISSAKSMDTKENKLSSKPTFKITKVTYDDKHLFEQRVNKKYLIEI